MENGIPNSLSDVLESVGIKRVFEQDSVIYDQGEKADYFYYLKKGRVRVFLTSESGMEKTLSIIEKGDILGEAAFFDGKPRISSACAVLRSELVAIDRETLTEMIQQYPQIALELFRLQARTIRILSAQLDSMTFMDAKGRIAWFLLQANETDVRTTHEEIAAVIGVSRVTVSKIMAVLVRDGIVKTGYKTIRILDKNRLEMLCESKNL